ncbi:MAG: nicotinate phosphoribosyltransferase [Spirochaetia bacterium]
MRGRSGLFTDLYELTMVQGYVLSCPEQHGVFDMFFRKQPFDGGFTVFAGLEDLLVNLENLSFSEEEIEYLEGQGIFKQEFLDYLSGFTFSGDVYAADEGTPVFPNEPLIRVHGTLAETQLIESMLLNTVNFQTLIATKTARIYEASRQGKVLDFGMRRAQGPDGAVSATRAAYIGGASATSNTYAGKLLGIPAKGTMAHSWVMAFESEKESFEKFTELYPDNAILLIDTYDTLVSGLPNAIAVGKKMRERNKSIGVRLDSGDLEYLSKEVRKQFDAAGLEDAVITASNELDEYIIHQLLERGAPIDTWGVGTKLVTGYPDASLTGVYKLTAAGSPEAPDPVIKVSDTPEKTTNPGIKQVYRFYDGTDAPLADLLTLDNETLTRGEPRVFHHPGLNTRKFTLDEYDRFEPLLKKRMVRGKRSGPPESLTDIKARKEKLLGNLDDTYKRFLNPHVYKVSLSGNLMEQKRQMIEKIDSKTRRSL